MRRVMRRIECTDIKDARTRLNHIEKSGLGPVRIILEVLTEDEERGTDKHGQTRLEDTAETLGFDKDDQRKVDFSLADAGKA